MIDFDKARPEWRVMVRRCLDDPWKPVAWVPMATWDDAMAAVAELRADGNWAQVKVEERWCSPWQDPE